MTNGFFYYIILLLWMISMIKELRSSERLFRGFLTVASCTNPADMVTDGGEFIVALTRPTRTVLVVLIGMPKILISLYLVWIGCDWLSASCTWHVY